jgi:hypothetical protein
MIQAEDDGVDSAIWKQPAAERKGRALVRRSR